jgi:hypothetical protein
LSARISDRRQGQSGTIPLGHFPKKGFAGFSEENATKSIKPERFPIQYNRKRSGCLIPEFDGAPAAMASLGAGAAAAVRLSLWAARIYATQIYTTKRDAILER